MRGPKGLLAVAVPILLLAGGTLAFRRASAPNVPTAEVTRGDFVDDITIRGNVKALHSLQLSAPSIASNLQILKLAAMGTPVKKGDIVVQFDTTTLQTTLDQKRSELKSTEADIDHSRAEAHLAREQQATDLLQGRYDVDRAKLDTSKNEILSEIDGAETRLKLADAEQKYKELQQKEVSSRDSADADIESKVQKRAKSLFDVRLTERQLASLTLRAPEAGVVTIMPNSNARNWTQGGTTPDFKEGDRAWPGAVIAELPDMSTLRVSARVDESDRGRLKPTQAATVRIDAIADKEFPATVVDISPIAKVDYSSWPLTKNFDITLQIHDRDPRIHPGLSASANIALERIQDSILVPLGAVFERNGRSVVYVLHKGIFEERSVQVMRRSRNQVMIAGGLQPGEKVATRDLMQEKPGK